MTALNLFPHKNPIFFLIVHTRGSAGREGISCLKMGAQAICTHLSWQVEIKLEEEHTQGGQGEWG